MARDPDNPPQLPGLDYVGPLGSGGYSEVYLYEQQRPRMKVAVKVLTAPDITDRMRRQFTAEGDAMATLADHPFIVQVFRADIAPDGRPYLVMKYYPQPNLGQRARHERLSVAEALRTGIQISGAVETAHRAGMLHRDIKPANILTGQYGIPGLTDFGIAATTTEAAGADGLSVPWSPPEVLFGSGPPDVRSDVYSLAATVWNLLVGRSPFEIPGGDNKSVALMRRIRDTPPPITGRADVPDSLDRLLQQALAKQPAARPHSALAFARALQRIEQEQRLPLTQIVVPDDARHGASVRSPDADDDATRIRTPTRISAQGHAAAGTGPVLAHLGEEPRPVAAPSRRRSTVPYAIAGLVVLVVVAVIVGMHVVGRSSRDPSAAAPTPTDTGQLVVPLTPPGTPLVRASRAATKVTFSWTYDSPLASDSFLWRVTGAATTHRVDTPRVTVAGSAAPTCIQVEVFRQDGTGKSAWSKSTCDTK